MLSSKKGTTTAVRNYKAAEMNRLTDDWKPIEITNNQVIYKSLNILRARSRTCARNDVYAKRFLQLIDQNVIGHTGIKIIPQVVNDTDGKADEEANKSIMAAWKRWSKKDNCDATGRNAYKALQSLMLRNMAIDGEAIARIIISNDASPYGMSLQMIDPMFLDKEMNQQLTDGNRIVMGVEVNKYARPLAYWFIDGSQTNVNGNAYTRAKGTIRVPAAEIIHLFVSEFSGQIRGIPWFSTALIQMHQLEGYQDAAVMASRIGASKMGFFIPNGGESYEGEEDGTGGVTMEVSPGTFEELPAGYTYQPVDWTYPHDQYPEFVKATLRGVAAGLGVSYHTLASDLSSVNFSAGRLGAQEDREFYKTLQEFINDQFNEPVFAVWLPYSLLTGKIVSKRGRPLPFTLLNQLSEVVWRGRRWAHLEPLKEIQAAKEAHALGVKSKSQIIRDQGDEPDEVFAEIEADFEKSPTIIDETVNKQTEALLLEEEKEQADENK